jgi:hypothetical protein
VVALKRLTVQRARAIVGEPLLQPSRRAAKARGDRL